MKSSAPQQEIGRAGSPLHAERGEFVRLAQDVAGSDANATLFDD